MTEHVSQQELILAIDGELAPDRHEMVRAHTRSCPACRAQWTRLAELSQEVAELRSLRIEFEPQEVAVNALLYKLDQVGRKKKRFRILHSTAMGNTLAAVAVAITCIVALPSLKRSPASPAPVAVSRAAVTDDLEPGVPAGYVSLPFADPALPLDDAEVLPVELTPEDLALMGVSANADGTSDIGSDAAQGPVKAEILIGMDGWPRAIRIVQ